MCSEARMLSLLQQMCVPAAVDAAEDDGVSHGGESAAGKQADDAMELEGGGTTNVVYATQCLSRPCKEL